MKNCLGIINLNEDQSKMGELVRYRTLASLHLSARYRIIDFVLSNMTNSGLESIGLFTENKSRSLISHLSNGRPWDLHRKREGLRIFNFSDYNPNIDDVHSFNDNIEFIEESRKEYVIISPSYMICNIDFNKVFKHHVNSENDITIVYKSTKNADENFLDCGILNLNEENRVIGIGENIGKDKEAKINMEMYIMKTQLFIDIINKCIKSGIHRKIQKCIEANLENLNVGAYKFNGYLSCINSIKSYFDTNIEILNQDVNRELFHSNNPIYTKSQDEPPTLYTKRSEVSNSIIANGSYIEGKVKNCIIGRQVVIEKGAELENCIVMQNSIIKSNVVMKNVITDKKTIVNYNEVIKGTKEYPVTIQRRRGM